MCVSIANRFEAISYDRDSLPTREMTRGTGCLSSSVVMQLRSPVKAWISFLSHQEIYESLVIMPLDFCLPDSVIYAHGSGAKIH